MIMDEVLVQRLLLSLWLKYSVNDYYYDYSDLLCFSNYHGTSCRVDFKSNSRTC